MWGLLKYLYTGGLEYVKDINYYIGKAGMSHNLQLQSSDHKLNFLRIFLFLCHQSC